MVIGLVVGLFGLLLALGFTDGEGGRGPARVRWINSRCHETLSESQK